MSLALIAAATFICYVVIPANATTAGFVFLVGILVIAATWGLDRSSGGVRRGHVVLQFLLPSAGRPFCDCGSAELGGSVYVRGHGTHCEPPFG